MARSRNASCAEEMRSVAPQVCGGHLCDQQERLEVSTVRSFDRHKRVALLINSRLRAAQSFLQCIHDAIAAWTSAANPKFS